MEQARVAKQVFKRARNARMHGDIDIEKDMLFLATAESDESVEEYLCLFDVVCRNQISGLPIIPDPSLRM
jgi:hypothetical protein